MGTKYYNETDITMNVNKLQHNVSPVAKHRTKVLRPRFRSNVKIELSDDQEILEAVQFHDNWVEF